MIVRHPDDKEPLSALAFKIMNDPFVGSLTFVRIYSGTMQAGTYIYNSVKDKKERVGRMLLMHSNKREDLKEANAGDIIALDTGSQTERYIKATNLSGRIAGIHTDEYAMLIGGNKVAEGQDFLEENLPDFIPVSLAGRVHTKVVGPVHTGDYIVLSSTPGVGRAIAPCESYPANKIVGYACEGDDSTDLRLVKVRVGGV